MAVEERVIIKIDIDADIDRDLRRVEQQIRSLEDRFKNLDRNSRDVDRGFDRVNRRMGRTGGMLKRLSRSFLRFFAVLTKFSFVGYALQVGVLTAALISARLAMGAGRLTAKGYELALRGVAAAAAGVATAIAVAAASIRQFSEAQLAPFVGGVGSARRFLGGVDPQVAGLLGREETMKLAGALGRSGKVSAEQSTGVLRQLFNMTGGDSSAMSSLIGTLGEGGDAFGAAALRLGPQGEGIAKSTKGMTSEQLVAAIGSGSITPENLQGFSRSLGQTMIGTIKTQFVGLFDLAADLGQSLIEPFRSAFQQMGGIMRGFLVRNSVLIQKFGAETFAPALIDSMDSLAKSMSRLLEDNLPKLEGFAQRTREIFGSIRDWFVDIGDRMRPLEAGARVVMRMFGGIFGGFAGNGILAAFNELVQNNSDKFIKFGDSVGNFISALLGMGASQGDNLIGMLGALTTAFNRMAQDVIPDLAKIIEALHDIIIAALPTLVNVLDGIVTVLAPMMQLLSFLITGGSQGGGAGGVLSTMALGGMMMGGSRRGRGAFGRGQRTIFGVQGSGVLNKVGAGALGKAGMKGMAGTATASMAGAGIAGVGIAGGVLAAEGLGSISDRGANAGSVGMTVGGAAAMGAAIGTAIAPGVGTAVGAGVGAIGGAMVAWFADGAYEAGIKDRILEARQKNTENAIERGTQITGLQQLNRGQFVREAGLRNETYSSQLDRSVIAQLEIQNMYASANEALLAASGLSSDAIFELTKDMEGLRDGLLTAADVTEMFAQEVLYPFLDFIPDFEDAFGSTDAGQADREARYLSILDQFSDLDNISADKAVVQNMFDFLSMEGANMFGLMGPQLMEHVLNRMTQIFGTSEENLEFINQFGSAILGQANLELGRDDKSLNAAGMAQQEAMNQNIINELSLTQDINIPVSVTGLYDEVTLEHLRQTLLVDIQAEVERVSRSQFGTGSVSVGPPIVTTTGGEGFQVFGKKAYTLNEAARSGQRSYP